MEDQELATFLIEKIEDVKGWDMTTLDISEKSNFANYMIICSDNSKRHVKSIAQ